MRKRQEERIPPAMRTYPYYPLCSDCGRVQAKRPRRELKIDSYPYSAVREILPSKVLGRSTAELLPETN